MREPCFSRQGRKGLAKVAKVFSKRVASRSWQVLGVLCANPVFSRQGRKGLAKLAKVFSRRVASRSWRVLGVLRAKSDFFAARDASPAALLNP